MCWWDKDGIQFDGIAVVHLHHIGTVKMMKLQFTLINYSKSPVSHFMIVIQLEVVASAIHVNTWINANNICIIWVDATLNPLLRTNFWPFIWLKWCSNVISTVLFEVYSLHEPFTILNPRLWFVIAFANPFSNQCYFCCILFSDILTNTTTTTNIIYRNCIQIIDFN